MYAVYSGDKELVRYKYRIQCIIWMFRKNMIWRGIGDFWSEEFYIFHNPDYPCDKVEIREVEDEDNL